MLAGFSRLIVDPNRKLDDPTAFAQVSDGIAIKLDDTGQNTFGGAVGLQYLFDLDRQIVVEGASVQVIEGENEPGRPARGDEYALGMRYPVGRTSSLALASDAASSF